MVTATRTTSDAAALAHLLDTGLALSATSPIRLSLQLNGYDNLQSVVGIFESELESLEYVPLALEEGVPPLPVKLLMAHRQLLRYFLRWMSHLRNTNGGPLSPYEIVSLARHILDVASCPVVRITVYSPLAIQHPYGHTWKP
jgi:hypothetical protein